MDRLTNSRLRALDRRLQGAYEAAAREAIRREREHLARMLRDAPRDATQRQYWEWLAQRNDQTVRNVGVEIARTGDTAKRMINGDSLNIFATGHRMQAADLIGQAASMGQSVDFNMIDRNALNAIFNGQDTVIGQMDGFRGAFEHVGFREIAADRRRGNFFLDVAYGRLGDNAKIVAHLQNELAQALMLGEGIPQITRRIRNISNMSYRQARSIARTETLRAFSQGKYIAAAQMEQEHGLPVHQYWHHTAGQDHPREWHQDLAGTSKPLGESFVTAMGNKLKYPLDPSAPPEETIHCGCTNSFRIGGVLRSEANARLELNRQMADERRREREDAGRVLRRGEAEAMRERLDGTVTANGMTIAGTKDHAIHRSVLRDVSADNMVDALQNPLNRGTIVTTFDDSGRPEQTFIGRHCTVGVNPGNREVVTVYPTGAKALRRYGAT